MEAIDWLIWDEGILLHKKDTVGLTPDEEATLKRTEESLEILIENETVNYVTAEP